MRHGARTNSGRRPPVSCGARHRQSAAKGSVGGSSRGEVRRGRAVQPDIERFTGSATLLASGARATAAALPVSAETVMNPPAPPLPAPARAAAAEVAASPTEAAAGIAAS